MSVADRGQVYVPAHVLNVVASGPWTFTPVGSRALKGLRTPVDLYEFCWWENPMSPERPETSPVAGHQPAGLML